MTNNEAITTLKANYPDACYTQLREAVDAAIKALGALEQLSKNSPELYKGNGELSGLYDMLLPESPYVFYDNDRGCCINTADVLTLIAQLSVTGHWIPCKERLPEENRTVIASTEYEVYPEARYTKEDGWEWAYEYGADYWVELDKVKAWQPLPEPYKEGES